MSITSLSFILFIIALFSMYYLLPKRCQWVVLLVASLYFYLCSGWRSFIYILTTSISVYGATVLMQGITDRQKQYFRTNKALLTKDEKSRYKKKAKIQKKTILLLTLFLNLGFLAVFKYFHFALAQVNAVLTAFGSAEIEDTFRLIAPLGISFYTFQAVGYLVDIYWENTKAEKNYFKVLLFVSFFPQITQGPISEYTQLSEQLFAEHSFSYKNYSWGAQRMVWGFFKKMIIADVLAKYVADVFANYEMYSGIATLIGAFMYSTQIYADFSGYMDIMCGFCEMLGIQLTENFDRPYFSKSIAEYWRRWHISLGAWFKRYIYYPIGMSTWNRKLAKVCREKAGKHFSDTLPASIALVVVWLATGFWHGASWAYITWGLVNGLFIIFSMWMEPVYAKTRQKLRINEEAWTWKIFQTVRTFILVTFIKVLPEVGSLSDGVGLLKNIFTSSVRANGLWELLPFVNTGVRYAKLYLAFAGMGTVMMFCASLIQNKGPVRSYFNRLPMIIRVAILAGMVVLIASFGVQAGWGAGGFMYANF